MSKEQDITIQTYEDHAQDYIAANAKAPEGKLREWIDQILEPVAKDANILELGSAYGRDADYMEAKGYKVNRTDVVKNFVKLMQNQGHEARLLNALTDDFGDDWDLVYANAVLVHFTPEECDQVLKKVYDCLSDDGFFAFSVKQGTEDGWSKDRLGAERYFSYWQPAELKQAVSDAGLKIVDFMERSGHSEWLHVIAKK